MILFCILETIPARVKQKEGMTANIFGEGSEVLPSGEGSSDGYYEWAHI